MTESSDETNQLGLNDVGDTVAAAQGVSTEELQNYLVKYFAASFGKDAECKFQPEVLQKFINDPALNAAYIGVSKTSSHVEVALYQELSSVGAASGVVSWVVALKKGQVLSNLEQQLTMVAFPVGDASIYETLYSLLHYAISPFVHSKDSGASDSLKLASTKKRLAELELSFLQLQQNVEVPEVHLVINPVIQEAIDKARQNGGKRATVEDLGAIAQDTTFLNKLQNEVNVWIKEVQKVTRLTRDVKRGNAVQEIDFWLSMEKQLEKIELMLKEDGFLLTMDVLKSAKRFHATVSFVADTGLKEVQEMVQKYNVLIRDFPISDLLAVSDMDKVRNCISLIFQHLNKKLRLSAYPVERAVALVEVISSDLNDQCYKILSSKRLFQLSYDDFKRVIASCDAAFKEWDEQVKEFVSVAREVGRKRTSKFILVKVNANHLAMKDRVEYLSEFRRQHFQLHEILSTVLSSENKENLGINEQTALADINFAFSELQKVDILDTTTEGTSKWADAEAKYNENVSRVENHIILYLRDQLSNAKSSNDMFKIFLSFNALFVRPKIRGAIQEYQNQLIQNVKQDIQRLNTKFVSEYRSADVSKMHQARDIPATAGLIIWTKMIENQLNQYMKKIEGILGQGWESYVEGQKLHSEYLAFSAKLDVKPLFDTWLSGMGKKNLQISGPVMSVLKNRATGKFELKVNFDSDMVKLFKESRNLVWLGFHVPHSILQVSKDAKRVYPHAVTLSESVRGYEKVVQKVNLMEEDQKLLIAGYYKAVQGAVKNAILVNWEQLILVGNEISTESESVNVVQTLYSTISTMQEKILVLHSIFKHLERELVELQNVSFEMKEFQKVIKRIQELMDQLVAESFSNTESFSLKLNERLEGILVKRLEDEVKTWKSDVLEKESSASVFKVEVNLKNQALCMTPSLDKARLYCFQCLHELYSQVSLLPKIVTNIQQVDGSVADNVLFRNLPSKINVALNAETYSAIDQKIENVDNYCQEWLRYQALWDLEPNFVLDQLGDDLQKWIQVTNEIKQARTIFDNQDFEKSFGLIVVNYSQVQQKVNAKYDLWQKEVIMKFMTKLGEKSESFFKQISHFRHELEERAPLDSCTTKEAVSYITFIEDLKVNHGKYKEDLQTFSAGQKLLERQRVSFPENWTYFEKVEGEWNAFSGMFKRKKAIMEEHLQSLQAQIKSEDSVLTGKIKIVLEEWKKEKPLKGSIKPALALKSLADFESKLKRLREDQSQLARAKEALLIKSVSEDELEPAIDELLNLKKVWNELSTVWSEIDELKQTVFQSVVGRQLRQKLDTLIHQLKDLPASSRQYEAFEYLMNYVKSLVKIHGMVVELRGDSMKERHWRNLFKRLNVTVSVGLNQMTLGQIYDLDLLRNETVVRDVLSVANGEMALEEYIKSVKDVWQSYAVDLVSFTSNNQNLKLIKGWDDIFAKCSEHLSGLQAMKGSPYFKVFEDEVISWEEKLEKVHSVFDSWIDVQRQWVYLEGVFGASVDIKNLLPQEFNRFSMINSEFITLMKKVLKTPLILDLIQIPNVEKLLERLSEILGKIQKALGEYLEKERSLFPRFYFLGDEALLEIIGNSKNLNVVEKHMKRMFAGINSFAVNSDGYIAGIKSKEEEQIAFVEPINFKTMRINEWLGEVEKQTKTSLIKSLRDGLEALNVNDTGSLVSWIQKYPAQIVILCFQIKWTKMTETSISDACLSDLVSSIEKQISVLSGTASSGTETFLLRKKCEQLIAELVYQRNTARRLDKKVKSVTDPEWQNLLRFYPTKTGVVAKMADSQIEYGFEYVGLSERLIQTPLTSRCNLTLTQALKYKYGASPFGPAGTGKTESVKFLGAQLARFVLVFCCDEQFDYTAMGRIFIGLCQVGAWVCFDEFNRLSERMLSSVSQQIQTIQEGLRKYTKEKSTVSISLLSKEIKLNSETAVFITMNPDYSGRSQLPNNLKKLFRPIAMTKPDKELIAQVLLYSQGFLQAEILSNKVVPLFQLMDEQLSRQSHYDFGLRALKSVLASAGNIKKLNNALNETQILIDAIIETIEPKLVSQDTTLFKNLLRDFFPSYLDGGSLNDADKEAVEVIAKSCGNLGLLPETAFTKKILQLHKLLKINHGVMVIGNSGSGKSSAISVLAKCLHELERKSNKNEEVVLYNINPKTMSKDQLYGVLDNTTREWSDGLFTSVLRRIIDNVRGEMDKTHWVVFDGEVDPIWIENLNSVLDDNKMLTLPNGERLGLPNNVRLLFEVEDLKNATLATVSRCGMIWFHSEVVTSEIIVEGYLSGLESFSMDQDLDAELKASSNGASLLDIQRSAANVFKQLNSNGLISSVAEFSKRGVFHIMDFHEKQCLENLFALLDACIIEVANYQIAHPEFLELVGGPGSTALEMFFSKKLLICLFWSFSGDSNLKGREALCDFIASKVLTIVLPAGQKLLDVDVELPTGDWFNWRTRVPSIDLESHAVLQKGGDLVVIPTIDTQRHENLLKALLFNSRRQRAVVLSGPPGSGKSMSLFSCLRSSGSDVDVVGLNFSSSTSPEYLLKTMEQHVEYRKMASGYVMRPKSSLTAKRLVFFCDEINLPQLDDFGTQRVVSFLRQLVEKNGFWRTTDKQWVTLERIQFVGACNPPTDPGRVPLSSRFLRHSSVLMVDYPGKESLIQIYKTFNKAMLKVAPNLKGMSDQLTEAMVSFFLESQSKFTQDQQKHYIYSPRELTRWLRGIYEAIRPIDSGATMVSAESLIRIFAYEALRLFQDRLVSDDERQWTDNLLDRIVKEHFPSVNHKQALQRPILFSSWLTRAYTSVDEKKITSFVDARLRVFYEEEMDMELILYKDAIDHLLRIDRVLRQPQGHLLLIGAAGSGRSSWTKFVCWMNGISVVQLRTSNKYTSSDFDEDLRGILRRTGTKGEKVCLIIDESNILETSFLERLNTLLANGEVPGLFEPDDYNQLLAQCKETSSKEGLLLQQDELPQYFQKMIARNLHVVFTMNVPSKDSNKATASPALFNRCVLNWYGEFSDDAIVEIAHKVLSKLDFVTNESTRDEELNLRNITSTILSCHKLTKNLSVKNNVVSAGQIFDVLRLVVKLYTEKRQKLEEEQIHVNHGLEKLEETVKLVSELRKNLKEKQDQLEQQSILANQKLEQMVNDQKEAEEKKAISLNIRKQLEVKNKEIESRKKVVMEDLSKAEPAVQEAKESVSNIKKQQLTEVRSMANPPNLVKLTMEAVCQLLQPGASVPDWKSVQQQIRKDDFIPSIVNFDTNEKMTKELRDRIKRDYLSNSDFNFESVNRASKACGPLVQWLIAQVVYSEMLNKVGPLREEVESLENEAESTRLKLVSMETMIEELESSIKRYKDEYAMLISSTQAIKADMDMLNLKVTRSVALIQNLSQEKVRWTETSQLFREKLANLTGNVLLSALFFVYAGYYDHKTRSDIMSLYKTELDAASISFDASLALVDYNIQSFDERNQWENAGLAVNDETACENALMLTGPLFENKYPLIVDPSGEAVNFLKKFYELKGKNNVVVSSFLDDSLQKTLESSIRFGNILIIQDAEMFDPIVNPVLAKEIKRTGGRNLIRIGHTKASASGGSGSGPGNSNIDEVDVSPNFKLFLFSRLSSFDFNSFNISSKCKLVNFTVTSRGLQNKILNSILDKIRPEIGIKKRETEKLQGEYNLMLRKLESSLLNKISESSGNILENDAVLTELETLKTESLQITRKTQEASKVMEDLHSSIALFNPQGENITKAYFVLKNLSKLNDYYEIALESFLKVFEKNLSAVSDEKDFFENFSSKFLSSLYAETSYSLLKKDLVLLGLHLCFIKVMLSGDPVKNDVNLLERVFKGFKPSSLELLSLSSDAKKFFETYYTDESITKESEGELASLYNTVVLKNIDIYSHNGKAAARSQLSLFLLKALVDKAVHPEQSRSIDENIVDTILLEKSNPAVKALDLDSYSVFAVVSTLGLDSSDKIEELALSERDNVELVSVAIGSQESLNEAEKVINHYLLGPGSSKPAWVLLKNTHLADAEWLEQVLEKKIYRLKQMKSLKNKLFFTVEMDANKNFPCSLLQSCRSVIFESGRGLQFSLTECLNTAITENESKEILPVEKNRLYFFSSFLHSIIMERLRFLPISFSRSYDFNSADYDCALKVIDSHLESKLNNVPVNSIPFESIKRLLKESVYGGRIDSIFDQILLDSIIDKLFSKEAFNAEYDLYLGTRRNTKFLGPDVRKMSQFVEWSLGLNQHFDPTFLGLRGDIDYLLARKDASELASRVRLLGAATEDFSVEANAVTDAIVSSGMLELLDKMKKQIDDCKFKYSQQDMRLPKEHYLEPIVSFYQREVDEASQLLLMVQNDLDDLTLFVKREAKGTNNSRMLYECFSKGAVPDKWMTYRISGTFTTLNVWFRDFCARLKQYRTVTSLLSGAKYQELVSLSVWLGGLFRPEAFLTATRQFTTRKNSWSLENLTLSFSLKSSPDSFTLFKVYFYGLTACSDGCVRRSESEPFEELTTAYLSWNMSGEDQQVKKQLSVPVYLNEDRKDILFSASLNYDDNSFTAEELCREGVCAFAHY